MKLQSLQSREVLDSRGNPTVAVRATLDDGSTAEAMVPSGASTGVHEALELRDNDPKRYGGKGVLQACVNVTEKIFPAIRDIDPEDQRAVDSAMLKLDGTENKSALGANAMLGVSLAVSRAVAVARRIPLYASLRETFKLGEPRLPYPTMNVLNGGAHADNGLDIQEYMIVPQQEKFAERLRVGAEVFHTLKKILHERGNITAVGDEGGFAPNIARNEEGLQLCFL
jgi:enolase